MRTYEEQEGLIENLQDDNARLEEIETDLNNTIGFLENGIKDNVARITELEAEQSKSRQAWVLLQALTEAPSDMPLEDWFRQKVVKLANAESQIERLEAELAKHQWVSVEDDRKPKVTGEIGAITGNVKSDKVALTDGYRWGWGYWYEDESQWGCEIDIDPTHWRPIHLPALENPTDTIKPATQFQGCTMKINEEGKIMCGKSKALGILAGRNQYIKFCSKYCMNPQPPETKYLPDQIQEIDNDNE